MARWKLFGRSKSKEEEITEPEKTEEGVVTDQEPEDQPLAEHKETLYTGVSTSKKGKKQTSSDQRIWRDVGSIEENIDTLHITKAQKPVTDLDKKVDKIIAKSKKK